MKKKQKKKIKEKGKNAGKEAESDKQEGEESDAGYMRRRERTRKTPRRFDLRATRECIERIDDKPERNDEGKIGSIYRKKISRRTI